MLWIFPFPPTLISSSQSIEDCTLFSHFFFPHHTIHYTLFITHYSLHCYTHVYVYKIRELKNEEKSPAYRRQWMSWIVLTTAPILQNRLYLRLPHLQHINILTLPLIFFFVFFYSKFFLLYQNLLSYKDTQKLHSYKNTKLQLSKVTKLLISKVMTSKVKKLLIYKVTRLQS